MLQPAIWCERCKDNAGGLKCSGGMQAHGSMLSQLLVSFLHQCMPHSLCQVHSMLDGPSGCTAQEAQGGCAWRKKGCGRTTAGSSSSGSESKTLSASQPFACHCKLQHGLLCVRLCVVQEIQGGCAGEKQECGGAKADGGSSSSRTRSHPLMLRLGYGVLPDLRLVQSEVQRLQLHESYLHLRQQQSTPPLIASSWR